MSEDPATTRTPPSECPKCGYRIDAASATDGDVGPSAGDYSICLNCGALSIFNADLTLRKPTKEEATEAGGNGEVIKAQITRAGMGFPDLRKR